MIKYIFLFASIIISASASAQNYFNERFEYGQSGWWGHLQVMRLQEVYIVRVSAGGRVETWKIIKNQ